MASLDLRVFTPKAEQRIYLDCSALISLGVTRAHEQGLGTVAKTVERDRATKIRELAVRCSKVGAQLVATVLGIEELAAHTRNQSRAEQSKPLSWKEYKKEFQYKNPQKVLKIEQESQSRMLAMLQVTVDEFLDLNGVFDDWDGNVDILADELDDTEPPLSPTVRATEEICRFHSTLLATHHSLDSMDALHIALGNLMGITEFVSFDRGWHVVQGITVLR